MIFTSKQRPLILHYYYLGLKSIGNRNPRAVKSYSYLWKNTKYKRKHKHPVGLDENKRKWTCRFKKISRSCSFAFVFLVCCCLLLHIHASSAASGDRIWEKATDESIKLLFIYNFIFKYELWLILTHNRFIILKTAAHNAMWKLHTVYWTVLLW